MSEVVLIVAIAFVALGVLGRSGRGSRGSDPDLAAWKRTVRDLQAQLDATQAELEQQRLQVAELAERLDFAERRLIQMKDPKALPPTS